MLILRHASKVGAAVALKEALRPALNQKKLLSLHAGKAGLASWHAILLGSSRALGTRHHKHAAGQHPAHEGWWDPLSDSSLRQHAGGPSYLTLITALLPTDTTTALAHPAILC